MVKELEMLDTDKDGILSDKELEQAAKITDLEEKITKSKAQEKMAWLSLIAILVFTLLLFVPFMDVTRVNSIGEFIGMFYITLAGVVATFMGTQAWSLRKP